MHRQGKLNCSISVRRIHNEEAKRNEMKKTLLYSTATIEQLRDWQENGADDDTLEFDSFEQMTQHLWEDYSILKKKEEGSRKGEKD